MNNVDAELANNATEQIHRETSAGSDAPTTEIDIYNARTAGADQEVEGKATEEEVGGVLGFDKAPTHEKPSIKPRLDVWTRDDNIEYDWGDSEEEL